MKTDDPKFTAYALDELEPAERAEVEALLAEEPAVAAELAELQSFAAKLRSELHAEEGAPLTSEQRAELLGENPRIVPISRLWWRRPWVQSAAAACVIVGVSAAIFSGTEVRSRSLAERPAAAKEVALSTSDYLARLPNTEQLSDALPAPLAEQSADFKVPAIQPSQTLALNSPDSRTVLEFRGLARTAPDSAGAMVEHDNANWASQPGAILTFRKDSETPLSGKPLAAASKPELPSGPAPASEPRSAGAKSSPAVAATDPTGLDASPPLTLLKEEARGSSTPLALAKAKGAGPEAKSGRDARDSAVARPSAPVPAKATSQPAQFGRQLYAGAATASAAPESLAVFGQDGATMLGVPDGRGRRSVDWSGQVDRFGVHLADAEVQGRQAQDGLERGAERAYRWQFHEQDTPSNTEAYDLITDNAFLPVKDQPLSTFSIDVDSASYSNVRRFLHNNQRPPRGAVRIEELVNYFRYDYPQPDGPDPFSCALEVATCPWQTEHRLVRIGLKGKEIKREARPPSNLVFLVDVSGSMAPPNRLGLVKQCLRMLVDQLTAQDTVAIAVYAGASGCVLEPTSDRAKIREALDRLDAGGSTNGAAGIQLAYDLAQRSFKKGGTNRVILCTDGDFNVGITNQSELVSMIQGKAKTGIFLSVLGFGMGNLKDSTLEKLADKGNGNYAYIDTLNEGRRVFVEQMSGTLITIAKDVKVQVEFNPAQVGAYRLIGYENRLLAKEDFNDDTKDAGEIGAGHTVTALYEVVPVGKTVPQQPAALDDLKYQPRLKLAPEAGSPSQPPADPAPGAPRRGDFRGEYYLLQKEQPQPPGVAGGTAPAPLITAVFPSPELLTVKVRYKQPEGDASKKLDFPLTDSGATWEKSSRDFRWAASVASFGLLLRDSPHKGSANWSLVEELASEGKGEDRDGYRAEFVGLVEKAKALGR